MGPQIPCAKCSRQPPLIATTVHVTAQICQTHCNLRKQPPTCQLYGNKMEPGACLAGHVYLCLVNHTKKRRIRFWLFKPMGSPISRKYVEKDGMTDPFEQVSGNLDYGAPLRGRLLSTAIADKRTKLGCRDTNRPKASNTFLKCWKIK